MKLIRKSLGLVVAFLLTIFIFGHVSYMYRAYPRQMGYYALEKGAVDVVLIGTSNTFSSFMPMEAYKNYGLASFVFATNMQMESTLDNSLKEVLKYQSPELIMVDISPFMVGHYPGYSGDDPEENMGLVRYNVDSMRYSLNRAEAVAEMNEGVDGDFFNFLNYYFDISRYHSRTPILEQFNNASVGPEMGYGYLKRNEVENIAEVELLTDDGSEAKLEEVEMGYLNDLLKVAGSCEERVVFFCSPQYFKDSAVFGKKNYVSRLVQEAGFEFWDFSADIERFGFDLSQDFWSHDHTDSLGAEKATKVISEIIIENCQLSDRRGDPKCAVFEENMEAWELFKANANGADLAE